MTREEEIRQEISLQLAGSFGNYSEGYEEGFIEGAKWADETMIDKACEWVKENIDIYATVAINLKSSYPEIVLCDTFEKKF